MKIYDKFEPRRTVLLWILCMFTFIGAGFSAIGYLIYAIAPDILSQSMEAVKSMPMFADEQIQKLMEAYVSVKSWKYALMCLCEAVIFIGPMLMLVKLNPIGFHIYTLGQIARFCIQTFVIGGMLKMNTSNILWIIIMIMLFATQLKYMRTETVMEDNVGEEEEENNNEIDES